MNKKSLLAVLATFALVSCSSDMPKITNDRAKALANEIIIRQDNPKVFTQPKNFSYKETDKIVTDMKSVDSGHVKGEETTKTIYAIDVNKLVYRSYTSEDYENYDFYTEIICYYDNNGVLRTLLNKNGHKTRHEESMDYETAQNTFEYYRDNWQNVYTWHESVGESHLPFALSSFSSELDYYQGLHEQYKDEKDQHCNVRVGSSNSKALQVKLDTKEKAAEGYSGYLSTKCTVTIKNDLFSSCNSKVVSKTKWNEDKQFYNNTTATQSITMSYGNAKIHIPNYNNYKLESQNYGL